MMISLVFYDQYQGTLIGSHLCILSILRTKHGINMGLYIDMGLYNRKNVLASHLESI